MVDDHQEFLRANQADIAAMASDSGLQETSQALLQAIGPYRHSYHFSWLGLPIIQLPEDIVVLQELVWSTAPEVVVETGVARGGSLVLYASLLTLLGGHREVIGIDIDMRAHNRQRLASHRLAAAVHLIEGSSTAPEVIEAVHQRVAGRSAMVVLDADHSHDHVLAELRAYASLVPVGGYLVVLDTVIEQFPPGAFPGRAWGPGNNPATAVEAFLAEDSRFAVDQSMGAKLLLSTARRGFLRRNP
jgi:cephalosporin hydroxylase